MNEVFSAFYVKLYNQTPVKHINIKERSSNSSVGYCAVCKSEFVATFRRDILPDVNEKGGF
jgi:formate dehydrogenase maturation protein FdhE